jgi:alkylation response protein AidB-like acyl-CoA dehydrogenase
VVDPTAEQLQGTLRQLERAGRLDLPAPGAGATAERHRALYQFGRDDLSVARLAEAHLDALAILAEAGAASMSGSLYGVWASDGPHSRLSGERGADGSMSMNGAKLYCSGAPILDAALVTVHCEQALWLVALPLNTRGLRIEPGGWATPAFAATGTSRVNFKAVHVTPTQIIGGPNWYLERVGFWRGAIGPAACWAGGAAGLVDAAQLLGRADPHSRAHLGALEATAWNLQALLDQAGIEIDAGAEDSRQAQRRALIVRHLVERACVEVLERFGRATGPQLLAFDAAVARRHAELTLYIRQCHAERDLEAIPVSNR